MTGIIALNIVIGLIFIYALYSLLTTTIMEFVAIIFQLRARNLKRAIRRMLDDGDEKVFYNEFANTPVIKYLSSNRFSWFFKVNTFPSYISPKSFTQALVYIFLNEGKDGLLDQKDRNNGDKAILNNISDKLLEDNFLNKDTSKYLRLLLLESKGDFDKFTKSVEKWFDDMMVRCVGWYKKNITFLTFGLAFIMAMLFNIDTIQIIDQLSKDPKAREQYVELAGQLLNNTKINTAIPAFDTTLENRLLKDSALFAQSGNDSVAFKEAVMDSVNKYFLSIEGDLLAKMNALYVTSQEAESILRFKRKGCTPWFFNSWLNLLGCLITALALSLGAPFWFDLLNKFMKLRSSLGAEVKKDIRATVKGISD